MILVFICVKDMNKWIGLIVICVVPVLYSTYGFIIPQIIKIEKEELSHHVYNSPTPFKIIQLSDIHLGAVYQNPT